METLLWISIAWLGLLSFSLAVAHCAAGATQATSLDQSVLSIHEADTELFTAEEVGRTKRGKQRETVFLVDDDAGILAIMEEVLASEGFTVHSFTDPLEALSAFACKKDEARLLVTDFCMSQMNGLELTERLKATQPQLRSIIISGQATDEALEKMPRMADKYLSKPFALTSLIDTVNDTISDSNRAKGRLAAWSSQSKAHLN